MAYAGLHNHSPHGSLLDSIARIEDLVNKAKEYGYVALAQTDHGKMHSTINFYKECIKQGVKPIIGLETYECDDINIQDDTRYHLILLAKNNEGLKALYKLSSLAFVKGFYHKPRIDIASIKPYAENLVILSGCMAGRLSKIFYNDKITNDERSDIQKKEEALKWLNIYKESFPNFYIELQNHGTEDQCNVNRKLLELAKETKTPFVLTDDVHYINKEDMKAHEVFVMISQFREVGESYTDCYVKSEQEIHSIMDAQIGYKDTLMGIKNTALIAEMCNVEIDLKSPNQMPEIKIPEGFKDTTEYYKKLINDGWIKRGVDKESKEFKKTAKERILKEFDTLEYLGYIDYFLMLKQLVDEAKIRNIPLGSSRGSGGNCYSLYLLGVTEVDSIKWNLDFSRFATKGRKSVADYDMDISKRKRKEMIDIAKELFNDNFVDILESKVVPICTFNSLSTKVAIKDIGKVLYEQATQSLEENVYIDLSYEIRDEVAKLIPVIKTVDELGQEVETETRLREALQENKQLNKYYQKYPLWFDYVIKLEGLPKSMGTHAAGVIIAPKAIVEYVPLCHNKQKELIAQYEMHNVLDDLHLIKMDFLGLDTVDVIDDTLKLANLTWKDIDVGKLNLNDPLVYDKVYKSGNCLGVFQMESAEGTKMCADAKCDNIDTVIAINAFNRPGTKDLFPYFINNKLDSNNIKLIHEDLREITKNSYGIMLYQEQALAVFRLANFPDEEVDLARRAIGKKDMAIMQSLKEKLTHKVEENHTYGLKQRGWTNDQIEAIWSLLAKQAEYSFNAGHSTAYGINSYWTAWLKTYYPYEFMTSLLNSEKGNYGQISKYIYDCKKLKIEVVEPSINNSDRVFSIKDNKILFGLSMVKGIGDKGVDKIMETRPFTSFEDYWSKCKLEISATVALIKSGAFNEFNSNKVYLLNKVNAMICETSPFKPVIKPASCTEMLELKLIKTKDEYKDKNKCLKIWNEYRKHNWVIKNNEKKEANLKEFFAKYMVGNELDWQMETLSMYLNQNPYQMLIDNGTVKPYDTILEEMKGVVVGTIIDIKKKNNKQGRSYAFVDVLNHEGCIVECGFWYTGYELYQGLLKKGNKLICIGKKSNGKFFIEECDLYNSWLQKIGFNKKIS